MIETRQAKAEDQGEKTEQLKNASFIREDHNTLDQIEIETEHGVETVTIPAMVGSAYWAVLKFMYFNHDRKIYLDEFCEGVAEILEERCFDRWERFKNKSTTKTYRKGKLIEKKAKPWQERIVMNARNLCRLGGQSPYGSRLVEAGHAMSYYTEEDGRGCFVLHTKLTSEILSSRKRGRKKKVK